MKKQGKWRIEITSDICPHKGLNDCYLIGNKFCSYENCPLKVIDNYDREEFEEED